MSSGGGSRVGGISAFTLWQPPSRTAQASAAELESGGAKDLGYKAAEDTLHANPDLRGIFAINDPAALGARAALEKAGKTDQVLIVGFDGQPEGKLAIKALYYNIDYRTDETTLAPGTLYFHAQYRQAQPNRGWTNKWTSNGQPLVNKRANLTGQDNYVWLDAKGSGQYAGVTMSILQNQDDWWGEGDDMFFVDGAMKPTISGTGAEDYFLGAWGFKDHPFSYQLYGAPIVGKGRAGARSSVYRFHLDSPIVFKTSFKATIEHGNANHRSDNYYSVAYWYQTEPHDRFPPLPPVEQRLPVLEQVGGPGSTVPATPAPAAKPGRTR